MPSQLVRGKTTRVLVLNPNSSQLMTDGLKPVIESVDLPHSTEIYTYTAPSISPGSINDGEDIKSSMDAVMKDLQNYDKYDGILVACYSVHPLVPHLQELGAPSNKVAVTGIFEASILTALSLLGPNEKWGIVTTGKFWEEHLSNGVKSFLGGSVADRNSKFAGVESTGLNASDFHHGVDPAVVEAKIREATKRLLSQGQVSCIAMGCAGMAGLEDVIRSAACEVKGEHFAYGILHVIDGLRAGIMQIDSMIKNQRLRRAAEAYPIACNTWISK